MAYNPLQNFLMQNPGVQQSYSQEEAARMAQNPSMSPSYNQLEAARQQQMNLSQPGNVLSGRLPPAYSQPGATNPVQQTAPLRRPMYDPYPAPPVSMSPSPQRPAYSPYDQAQQQVPLRSNIPPVRTNPQYEQIQRQPVLPDFLNRAQQQYAQGTAAGNDMSWMQQQGALAGPGGYVGQLPQGGLQSRTGYATTSPPMGQQISGQMGGQGGINQYDYGPQYNQLPWQNQQAPQQMLNTPMANVGDQNQRRTDLQQALSGLYQQNFPQQSGSKGGQAPAQSGKGGKGGSAPQGFGARTNGLFGNQGQ